MKYHTFTKKLSPRKTYAPLENKRIFRTHGPNLSTANKYDVLELLEDSTAAKGVSIPSSNTNLYTALTLIFKSDPNTIIFSFEIMNMTIGITFNAPGDNFRASFIKSI